MLRQSGIGGRGASGDQLVVLASWRGLAQQAENLVKQALQLIPTLANCRVSALMPFFLSTVVQAGTADLADRRQKVGEKRIAHMLVRSPSFLKQFGCVLILPRIEQLTDCMRQSSIETAVQ